MKRLASIFFLITLFGGCKKEDYSVEDLNAKMAKGTLAKNAFQSCAPILVHGTFIKDQAAADSNYVEVKVNVTRAGTYDIRTDTINGYSFSASGTFSTTGSRTVRLQATGKPGMVNGDLFTVRFDTSYCFFGVNVIDGIVTPPPPPPPPPPTYPFTLNGSPGACAGAVVNGSYYVGTMLNASNYVDIQVMVTQTGSWTLLSSLVNGMRFEGAGNFTTTGPQSIRLYGEGNPITAINTTMPISTGTSFCSFTVTVLFGTPPPANNYFPLTANSWWSYDNTDPTFTGDTMVRLHGSNVVIGSKAYTLSKIQANTTPYDTMYARKSGDDYIEHTDVTRYSLYEFDGTVQKADLNFLRMNVTSGTNWFYEFTGTYNGNTLKIKYQYVVEQTNVTLTVNGKTYTGCIKMRLLSQSSLGGQPWTDNIQFESWFANNIGLVQMHANVINLGAFDWKLRHYNIF